MGLRLLLGVVVASALSLLLCGSGRPPLLLQATAAANSNAAETTTVHVVQTCHLDVGFADTAAGELDNYRRYLVEAYNISHVLSDMGNPGGAGLIFTTHPYIVSLLLDCPPNMGFTCPNASERATIIKGLKEGRLVMQAFPHNSEVATFTPEFFSAALELGKDLAASLNISAPRVMTQRDVPGASRAIIPLLANSGVLGFSGGVNTASLPPDVPRAFVWRDAASSTEVLATLHPHGYGGITKTDCIELQGFNHILCPDYKGDNAGPWSVAEVLEHWVALKAQYPGAKIVPSSYDTYFSLLETVKESLPVVTQEMGDTWIYGISSDPQKNTLYRAYTRAWTKCIAAGDCNENDPQIKNFTRLLLKNPEHTWGGDVKTVLHDEQNWLNPEFHALQYSASNFLKITAMWQEQRDWGLSYPREALSTPTESKLLQYIKTEEAEAAATRPSLAGYTRVTDASTPLDIGGFHVAFDVASGAITSLVDGKGRAWANTSQPLGTYQYKIHSASDYETFFNDYAQRINGQIPSYFPLDFGKPGLYNNSIIANETINNAQITAMYTLTAAQSDLQQISRSEGVRGVVGSVVLQLTPADASRMTGTFGSPSTIWVQYNFTNGERIDASVLLENKTATRLPESIWFSFNPIVSKGLWTMNKLGEESINPLNVVVNGSRHLHAVNRGISHATSGLAILTMDAPLVSWGLRSPFPTPSGPWQPDMSTGAHFCLTDNIWGTNYVMWTPFRTDEHSYRYRFSLTFDSTEESSSNYQ